MEESTECFAVTLHILCLQPKVCRFGRGMVIIMTDYQGLTIAEVKLLQEKDRRNVIHPDRRKNILKTILHFLLEPIYLLLISAAVIYYILGEAADGLIMMGFVIVVIGIDLLQDIRTGNALKKLKELTAPKIRVIREGEENLIDSSELVIGDLLLLSEGEKIPADGYLISATGLCIDESVLTGESLGVWKQVKQSPVRRSSDCFQGVHEYFRVDYCYAGTMVILGTGMAIVDKIGNETEFGKLADRILKGKSEQSLLQKQVKRLAGQCAGYAAVLFVLVGLFTFLNLTELIFKERIIHSLLAGVVLALSMIPGEFPVILSVFLSMGALRLAKKKALVRKLSAVETIGGISVLCMDKTGTITQNKMQITENYIIKNQEYEFCKVLRLACKTGTYDPVEKAMLEYGEKLCKKCHAKEEWNSWCEIESRKPRLIKEYAFTNEMKAMGQVWEWKDDYLIVAKGSPETVLSLCELSDNRKEIETVAADMLSKGLRVIAVADSKKKMEESIADTLSECHLTFRGFLGFADPVRPEMSKNIENCKKAGIRIMMITGDHPVTAGIIAEQVGIQNAGKVITGSEIEKMSETELEDAVKNCNIFARVLPLHKMRIVKALKGNGEIVAMTGDGVNDSPAQKMADIGIAMGKHGSEVCREAADLILLDDNFTTVVNTIKDGRRIYQNIRKAINYVLAIHIPIALISLLTPVLGVAPEHSMLLPLHIVLLELVMDPICSIALERQPGETDIMEQPPRKRKEALLSRERFIKSSIQGFIIFLASFGINYIMLCNNYPADQARSAGIVVLVLSNILLVLENCSETESFIKTIQKIIGEKGIWLVFAFILTGLFIIIYSPIHNNLQLASVSMIQLMVYTGISAVAVLWYEVVKSVKRRNAQ